MVRRYSFRADGTRISDPNGWCCEYPEFAAMESTYKALLEDERAKVAELKAQLAKLKAQLARKAKRSANAVRSEAKP